jgi:hypothetical protein
VNVPIREVQTHEFLHRLSSLLTREAVTFPAQNRIFAL